MTKDGCRGYPHASSVTGKTLSKVNCSALGNYIVRSENITGGGKVLLNGNYYLIITIIMIIIYNYRSDYRVCPNNRTTIQDEGGLSIHEDLRNSDLLNRK